MAVGAQGGGRRGQPPDYPFASGNGSNLVTLKYRSWTDTRIEIAGFGGDYGDYGWVAGSGDAVVAALFNNPGGGTLGPTAAKAGRIP